MRRLTIRAEFAMERFGRWLLTQWPALRRLT